MRRYNGGQLEKLWDDDGEFGEFVRYLDTETDILSVLQIRPVRFVEVNTGDPLRWIPSKRRFEFWDSVRQNLHVSAKPYLEDYPGGFFYAASEWKGRDTERVIVLEKYH